MAETNQVQDPNSYDNLINLYGQVASGYNELDRMRKENYSLTQGGTSTFYSGPGGTTYGAGVPGTVISYGAPPADNRVSQISRPTSGSSGGGGGGASMAPAYAGPAVPKPVYETPKFNEPGKLKLPEWTPPERDPKLERSLRQEYMGPGIAAVRRATSQAVISSKSLDNPNARSMFIQNALSGVGQAMEQISAGAGKEARAEASQRYAEKLANYTFGWKAIAEETKATWDASWKKAIAEYGVAAQKAAATYATQASSYLQQPLNYQATGYGASTSKSMTPRTGAELRAEQQMLLNSRPSIRRVR